MDPRIGRLAAELDVTVRRLQWMQRELTLVGSPTPIPTPAAAPRGPVPGWVRAPAAAAFPPAAAPVPPAPPSGLPGESLRPAVTVARLLAAGGVLVTLIGVAFLLALAAQAGLLGPASRVGLGGALSVGLLGAAWRRSRRPGGRLGAIAFGATGIATAYLDVVAVTGIYHWVPPVGGLIAAGLVALGGLALGARWNSQWLGVGALAPIYLLAPWLAGSGYLLGGFTLVLAGASVPVRTPRQWPWLHLVRSGGTAATLGALMLLADQQESVAAAGAGVLAFAFALVCSAHADNRAGYPWQLPASAVISALPVFLTPVSAPDPVAAVALAVVGAAALAFGLLPGTVEGTRGLWFGLAAAAGAGAALVGAGPRSAAAVLLVAACAVVGLAVRDSAARWVGTALGATGLVLAAPAAIATTIAVDPASWAGTGTPAVVLAALAAAAFGPIAAWRNAPAATPSGRRAVWFGGCAVALAGVTAALVNLGWALDGHRGALWGHGLATVCAMAAGAALVVGARRRLAARAAGVVGLAIIGAAVAKLFLFDLAALDGVVRASAFLVVGLALLALGASYARATGAGDDPEGPHR